MSDDDGFFWFLAGCAVGDDWTGRTRPRDRWDVVAYAVSAALLAVAVVLALL